MTHRDEAQAPAVGPGSISIKSMDWLLIAALALAKLTIHLATFSNYDLHRDAFLYYAQSEHLAWGYIAVPPSIALVGKVATSLFGNTIFALRFFPALVGTANVVLVAMAVKELGGRRVALALACLAYILSPSFLHVNTLFQPVTFNHFYWLLSGYLILRMINRDEPRMWIWIGIVFGLAFLNKYSVLFFAAAFVIALALSRHRHVLASKYLWAGTALGLLIIAPNLLWQYQNGWPVVAHMTELRETQLVHVRYGDFIVAQFLMNMQALVLWLVALGVLLFHPGERRLRLFGVQYIVIILLLVAGSGKPYYTLGIYPLLFAFGAFFVEKYVRKYLVPLAVLLVAWMAVALYIALPMDGIPLLSLEQVARNDAFRWEDGKHYDVPQDMADMTGWKELAEEVARIYLALPPAERDRCEILCYHYGQAGAVMFYGEKYGLPHPICFNASFHYWNPDSLTAERVIWVHYDRDEPDAENVLAPLFGHCVLKAVIDEPYFRESGTSIYLCDNPTEEAKRRYREMTAGH